MVNIPIYRAKKINSDELVEGSLHYDTVKYIIREIHYDSKLNRIDANTLAIHFPNMIDKNGKKIFASLSEDGIGGDIVGTKEAKLYQKDEETHHFNLVMTYDNGEFIQKYTHPRSDWYTRRKRYFEFNEIEVIGIHKANK